MFFSCWLKLHTYGRGIKEVDTLFVLLQFLFTHSMADLWHAAVVDANLADEGTNTGPGLSSRAVSDGPAVSGHGGSTAGKKVKRSRSNTPEGGLAAQHYVWDNYVESEQPEPVKSEWQGFPTRHAQDHHAQRHHSESRNAAGPSSHFPDPARDVSEQHNGVSQQQVVAAKQEQSQAVKLASTKRTGLKVKLKFKTR